MFDEHVLYTVSRDKDFSAIKKELRFNLRKCCHVFGFVTIPSSQIKTLSSVSQNVCPIYN